MLITCRSCQAKYTVADDKAIGRSVRCRTCQATIALGSEPPRSQSFRMATGPSSESRTSSRRPPALEAKSESSHMFTLAALVGKATAPQVATKKAEPKKDNSGVIDLNALARAAEERAKKAQSEPPPSAFAREARVAEEAPSASRKVRFIGIAAAAVVLLVVGIVAASGGDEPNKAQPMRVAAASQHDTEVGNREVLASVPAPSASTDDAASAPHASGKAAPRRPKTAWSSPGPKLSKVTSGGTEASKAPAPPKPKPTPASDPCGCKGNLACAIKCFK